MRSKLLLVAVALLAVVVWMGTIRADISHDPSAPIAIPYDQTLEFTISGNHAGSFAYYSIEYPGDGRVITLDLDLAPGDPVAMMGGGMNVYAPNGYLIGTGIRSETKADRKEFQWSDYNPATWLIQVYNYFDNVPMRFRLEVTGLPGPQPTRLPVMSPMAAVSFSMAGGGLVGDRAGNFHYYKIESSGDQSEVTLHLYHAPDNQVVSTAFGINVYAPQGGILAATGSHEVTFDTDMAGTYLVQVFNYLHGQDVDYVLTKE